MAPPWSSSLGCRFSNLRMEWQNPLLRRVFEQLAQELTLVHYDGRGTGHSQQDVTDVSLEAMVSDLEAVIGRTELAQVSLLGQYNSFPFLIQFADIEGKPIHYVDEGSGPALLLVSSNTFGWPLAGYPAVRRMLKVVGSRPFGAVDSLANVMARFTASRYGVGRRMSKADRRAFLGPWRSRGSRRATRQVLAGLLRIDPVMATVEQSLQARLADLPVLTLFGRKNDPYGWQARFGQILRC